MWGSYSARCAALGAARALLAALALKTGFPGLKGANLILPAPTRVGLVLRPGPPLAPWAGLGGPCLVRIPSPFPALSVIALPQAAQKQMPVSSMGPLVMRGAVSGGLRVLSKACTASNSAAPKGDKQTASPSDAITSGIADSGRESGHGNIDANDPRRS